MLSKLKNWTLSIFREPPPSLPRMRLGPENRPDNPLMVLSTYYSAPCAKSFFLSYNFLLGNRRTRMAWAGGDILKRKFLYWRKWVSHRFGYHHQIKRLLRSDLMLESNSLHSDRKQDGRGYDAYDLVPLPLLILIWEVYVHQWDLGEFDQKGAVQTRWGTRAELLSACNVAQEHGIDILIDAVLNVCHPCFRFAIDFWRGFWTA